MEEFVKEMGFESVEEFHRLNASVDLSDPEKMKKYLDWKENDGTNETLNQADNSALHKTGVKRSFNTLLEVLLFIPLLPLLIMLDMMGMDIFSDDE